MKISYRHLIFYIVLFFTNQFQANAVPAGGELAAQICENTVCAPIEPTTALIFVGVQTVVDELNKGDKGFGPNGEIIKAIDTVKNDLSNAELGKNNDIVKSFNKIGDDLKKPGNNNDIVKAIRKFKIKF